MKYHGEYTMDLTIILWITATFAAFFVKGLCGFANTLVFSSIMGFGVNNVNISPVELVLGFPSNCIMTWKHKEFLKPKLFVPITLMVLAGSIPGAFMLKTVDARFVKIVFGIVVALVGIEMMLKEYDKLHVKESKIIQILIGIMAGIVCGIYGIGVLAAAYMSRITENSNEFKANLSVIFIFENIVRIITYSILGVITFETLKMSFLMIPVMLVATFAGIHSAKILDEKIVKKLVIVMLIISGIALVVTNI